MWDLIDFLTFYILGTKENMILGSPKKETKNRERIWDSPLHNQPTRNVEHKLN